MKFTQLASTHEAARWAATSMPPPDDALPTTGETPLTEILSGVSPDKAPRPDAMQGPAAQHAASAPGPVSSEGAPAQATMADQLRRVSTDDALGSTLSLDEVGEDIAGNHMLADGDDAPDGGRPAAERPTFGKQFAVDALKTLFLQGSPAQQKQLQALYENSSNASAQIAIGDFAALFDTALNNCGGKNDRRPLQALAKEYLALICKDGLEKKSAFGAFYFKNEKAYKQRLGLELKLIALSGADTAGNRLKLRNAVLENGVKPYIQTMLKEKYGDGVDVATLDKCCDLIDPRAREALDKIDEESEGYVDKNGASVRSVGRSLELIALWPELLRKIVDETHPAAVSMPPPSALQPAPGTDQPDRGEPGVDEVDATPSQSVKPAAFIPITLNVKRGVLPRAEGAPSIESVELGCAYRDGWGKFSDSDGKPVWRKATIDKDDKTVREDVSPDADVELTWNRRLERRTAPVTIPAPSVYRRPF